MIYYNYHKTRKNTYAIMKVRGELLNLDKYIDKDILEKYEFYNYGHALEILHDAFPTEWNELQECLRPGHRSI